MWYYFLLLLSFSISFSPRSHCLSPTTAYIHFNSLLIPPSTQTHITSPLFCFLSLSLFSLHFPSSLHLPPLPLSCLVLSKIFSCSLSSIFQYLLTFFLSRFSIFLFLFLSMAQSHSLWFSFLFLPSSFNIFPLSLYLLLLFSFFFCFLILCFLSYYLSYLPPSSMHSLLPSFTSSFTSFLLRKTLNCFIYFFFS